MDRLVAEIGDELLRRLGSAAPAPSRGEGLNIPDKICPDCTQRCVQTCARKSAAIVAAGADRITASATTTRVDPAIAALIDHTLLKPEATETEIVKLCGEARQYGFASVCVNPYWVPRVAGLLRGSPVKVCTVIGFPLGASTTESKRAETAAALRCGAQEIDMVMNVGALRSGNEEAVKLDIAAVVDLAHAHGAIVKVILETALLDDNQKAIACTLAKLAKADFVKTSTGFSKGGATVADIKLMRDVVGPAMGVKASGGIRSFEDVAHMTAAGATRIGASASVKIVEGAPAGARADGY
ncbi:MAG: deoxyribose-phosphate aldolase [Bryobacterales bacterium]|nr:deoxyribose-phosphate aldolase [Bryobacterales bacterium]